MTLKAMALITVVLLFSCGNKNSIPKGILKPAKMEVVLWDVLQADAFIFEFVKRDTSKKTEVENVRLLQQIFATHKVSKDEFYRSYDFYKAHPALMQPILDSMINKATRDKFINTRGTQINKDTSTVKE
jgi:hypothetical protein